MKLYEQEGVKPLKKRDKRAHKRSCGELLIIAGSKNMAGAAYFCGLCAYRTGAGLVRICTVECNRVILQTLLPEAVLVSPDLLIKAMESADAVVIGPGLGQSEEAARITETVLTYCRVPLLMDADALNLIAKKRVSLQSLSIPCIITPHMGEMSRLCGNSVSAILEKPAETCAAFAAANRVICLLKDAETVISDGAVCYRNHSGCPALATAGSGDCLAGIIGALLADKMEPLEAAYTGAYLHGKCGEIADKTVGERSSMARDIADAIPKAISEINGDSL